MNNIQLMLLLILLQNSYQRPNGSSPAMISEILHIHPRNGGSISRISLPDVSDTISELRHTLDSIERMNRMAGSLQNMPAVFDNIVRSLPTMLENMSLQDSSQPQSVLPSPENTVNEYSDIPQANVPKLPDLNSLMQAVGPLLQSLNKPDDITL